MAALRHPFEVIQEAGQGLDFGALGQGAGQELSNRLNAAGYNHTFDGLDRYKFDGSGGVDTYYGTIDAIKNKGFVQGRRGAGEQQLVFQPWHDRKEARAMRAMGMDLPNPDAPSGGQSPVQMRPPPGTGAGFDYQHDPTAQPVQGGTQMRQPQPVGMENGDGQGQQLPQASQEPWFEQILRQYHGG